MVAEATVLKKIRLKDARASLGLTQRELARRAGIHWQVVGKSERGGSIRITSAYAILNALNAKRAESRLPPLELKRLTWNIEGEENDG